MSSYDSDFTEDSFDSSSATGTDEPPTLDETLFDISLFNMFMSYMKSQQAAPNLHFLKQARLYRLYNAPRELYLQQATKMIWTYFAECAPMPVTVSADVKKKLQEMSLDPDQEVNLDKDSFSVAFGEVYNAVVPHFRSWIGTGEWKDAIPFHRLAPPTFNIVLTSSTLRVLFNKYIKSQLEHDGDGSVAHAHNLWKFCLIANDFRDGKYSHTSHLSSKKKGEAGGDAAKSEVSEKSEDAAAGGEDGKETNPEDYARRLYKKYKHQVSLPYDGSIPYAVYIIRALDHAIEEFDKSAIFARWIALKQFQGVDYQAKVVHQTLTPEGYAEPPSVGGAMTSSMLPFFLVLMSGSENGMNLEFMVDVLKFHRTYADQEKKEASSTASQSQGTNTGSSRKEMVDEARRIYGKYLESGEMYCDPTLVEEVHAALSKSGGKGVTPSIFRKCGAFIYQRAEHTWGREARATIAWANKSYENRSRATRALEEEFSMKVLPEGIDLQVVPNIDDVLQCPELSQDFGEFCGKEVSGAFASWMKAYGEYFQTSIQHRKPVLLKLVKAFGECASVYPQLQSLYQVLEKEANKRERITDSAIIYCTGAGIRATAQKYLLSWLVEHNMKWKTVPWVPAQNIMFSDMTMAYGMGTIERKIEEAALKGKTGFSKFLAKRQVKKNAVANVRSAPTKELNGPSRTVFATGNALDMMSFGKDFGKAGGASAFSGAAAEQFSLAVPSLADTLAAPFLRKFFESSFLGSVIPASEISLWEALTNFFIKYSSMEAEAVAEAQDEMRKDIDLICTKYHNMLKNPDQIKERAKKLKVIFPQFFRPYEMELYATAHEAFEKTLHEKGWH